MSAVLPLEPTPALGIPFALREGMATSSSASGRRAGPRAGLHVLVVEDRTELRELFVPMLTRDGAEVAQADTVRDALAACGRKTFDAILTDLGVPDAPGEILIRELGARRGSRPFVIVISGEHEARLASAVSTGADVVLEKPVEGRCVVGHLHALRTLRGMRSG